MKLCFIGCGAHPVSVYSGALERVKNETPGLELCACCDLDGEKAESFRRMLDFGAAYTDYRKMLAEIRPDAAIIATSYTVTADIAAGVLMHGVAAMIEKPPAVTLAECMKIVEASRASGSPTQVAFNRRYMPLVRVLVEDIAVSRTALQNIDFGMYRYNRSEPFFHVTAIHGIDAVSFVAGAPYKKITFSYQDESTFGVNAANIFMQCELVSGVHAQLSFCPVAGMTFERMTIAADHTAYELRLPVWDCSDAPGLLTKFRCDNMLWTKNGNTVSDGPRMFETNGFYREVQSFVSDIAAGKRPESDITTALQAVDIADHIRLRKKEYNLDM